VVKTSLVNSSKDPLRDLLAPLQCVGSITQNLGFNNWNKPVLLADSSVPGQGVGVLLDSQLRWTIVGDLEDSSPLGKLSTSCLVLGASLTQSINTLSYGLSICTREGNNTLVNLDTWDDVVIL